MVVHIFGTCCNQQRRDPDHLQIHQPGDEAQNCRKTRALWVVGDEAVDQEKNPDVGMF
jgi:hypothetical protein